MTMTTSEATSSTRLVLTSNGMFEEKGHNAEKARQKLAAEAMQKFFLAQSDRYRQERQWYLNLAFYYGHHHVKERVPNAVASGQFELYVPDAPYWRVRPNINHVRKICRKEISRLTAQKPNAYVVPASTEDRDIFAAQAGEQIWDTIWREKEFDRVIREAVFWQTVAGTGYIKQFWDATEYDKFNDMHGDINIEAVTPFHVFVADLREERIEQQPFVMHAQIKSKQWAMQHLGIMPEDQRLKVVDESLLTLMGINQMTKKDQVTVLEVWAKPGVFDELPQGGMFTIAANKIVQGMENWPYSHEEYPFSVISAMPTGKFYKESIVVDLIPLQRELNRTRGQIIEAKNMMAKPQLLAEKGAVAASKITNEPGLVIEYQVGFQPPQPMPMQNLPTYVTEEVNRLYADMSDISGQHEVSQGQTPPGVTAAVAISYLQEQDESMISTHFDSLEEAIQKTARQCLTFVKDYWEDERKIKVVGLDRSFDVQAFTGSDLRGNTDIRVESGSALPTSRAAKQAFITDLMKMGFIPAEEGLEVLEIGGLNRIYERVQVDQRQAQRENLKMRVATEEHVRAHEEAWFSKPEVERTSEDGLALAAPPLIGVNSYDNHAVHIEMHNRYRKSQSFETAPPLIKQLFEEHVRQHQEAIVSQLPSPLAAGEQPGVESGETAPGPTSEAQAGQEAPANPTGVPADQFTQESQV